MNRINKLKKELELAKNLIQASVLQRFFKTGKGDYGEGDIFLGIKVPVTRKIAKNYIDLRFDDLQQLLDSKIHEHRFISLVILIKKFQKAKQDEVEKKKIYDFYIKNAKKINNWDLVDVSCHKIVGEYLLNKPRDVLYKLAQSKNLWEKRISIISTYAFIRKRQFDDTLKISEILLHDDHDLIHKAVGWMLREIGKIDRMPEEIFLIKYASEMPRTMLRYAIEKFDKESRQKYLKML